MFSLIKVLFTLFNNNYVNFTEISYDLAAMTLKEAASLHATGYHFLQKHKGGVEGFLNEHPDFNYAGWITTESSDRAKLMNEMLTYQSMQVLAILKDYGDDLGLVERMEKFIPDLGLVMSEKTVSKSHYKFQTINHNDLHMSNVMFK